MSAFPAFLTAGTFFHAVSIIQRKTMLFKNYYGILLRKITRNGMLEEAETVRFVWIMKERNHGMKVCGIIAEYNPFHKGHAYQLNKIREDLRADYIVIAMSGDFVQRGEPALLEKHLRAEMALRCGADLVLELPVRVSTSSAEGFADGAIRLLASLGVVTHVCFGAETDSPLLHRVADLLAGESPEFRRILSSFLSEGFSMPAAREEAAAACLQDPEVRKILRQPNNILAVEYLKSIRRNGLTCEPWILIREGEGYHSDDLNDQTFASASAIRKALQTGSLEQALAFLPDPVKEILSKASVQDTFLFDKDLDSLLFYRLFCEDEDSLIQYADVGFQKPDPFPHPPCSPPHSVSSQKKQPRRAVWEGSRFSKGIGSSSVRHKEKRNPRFDHETGGFGFSTVFGAAACVFGNDDSLQSVRNDPFRKKRSAIPA